MIAASIVTYKTDPAELRHCLDCIKSVHEISHTEIVDNSRCDYIRDIAAEYGFEYTPSDNIGYGAANNISINKSLTALGNNIKYHLVLNSDIDFTPGVITCLVDKMEQDGSVGLIMPAVIGIDGRPQSCCHPVPSAADLLKHRFLSKKILPQWRKRYDLLPQEIGHDINVPYMHGCFMLFRLDALRKVGLFDERFFMYPEDIDITRRIHALYKTIATPSVTIQHLHRAESRHSLRMLWIHAINMLKYFAKWGFFYDTQRRRFNKRLRSHLLKLG